MEVDPNVAFGNVGNVVGNDKHVFTDKSAKSLMIVGVVAVVRSICGEYSFVLIESAYSSLLLRSEAPSRYILVRRLIVKCKS